MKCLVYGIYILEFVQSALITQVWFRKFVTSIGDVQAFNQVDMEWLVTPILTAIGEPSHRKNGWLMSNTPSRYILCPGILCASDSHFGTIDESCRSNYCSKLSKSLNTVKMLHSTQLSFIQLGGGIAMGVHAEQRKYYTLFWGARPMVFEWSAVAVWTTTPHKFIPNYLMTSLADVECWERPLRYHYCRIHDLSVCGLPPPCL